MLQIKQKNRKLMLHLIKVNIYLRNISEINIHVIMIFYVEGQTLAASLISNNPCQKQGLCHFVFGWKEKRETHIIKYLHGFHGWVVLLKVIYHQITKFLSTALDHREVNKTTQQQTGWFYFHSSVTATVANPDSHSPLSLLLTQSTPNNDILLLLSLLLLKHHTLR